MGDDSSHDEKTYTLLLERLYLTDCEPIELADPLNWSIAEQIFQKKRRVEPYVSLTIDQSCVHLSECFERFYL